MWRKPWQKLGKGAVGPAVRLFSGKPGPLQKMAKVLGSMGSAVVEPLLLELVKGQVDQVPVINAWKRVIFAAPNP